MTPNEIKRCCQVWLETLKVFGIERPINPREELEIAKAIQIWGADFVDLALYGARFEPSNKDFNPKNHISLGRVLQKKDGVDRIDKFANLGAAQRTLEKAENETRKNREVAMEVERTDPARVREIVSSVFKGMK